MSKHTPGIWRLNSSSIVADWPEGEVQIASIATTHWSYPDDGLNERMREQSRANARLIAAAPRLLEALKQVLLESDRIESCAEMGYAATIDEEVLAQVRAAIAEAEGEA